MKKEAEKEEDVKEKVMEKEGAKVDVRETLEEVDADKEEAEVKVVEKEEVGK